MASEKFNIPRDSTLKEIAESLHIIAVAQAGAAAPMSSWGDARQLVAGGHGPQALPVGMQLKAAHSVYGDIVFDVLGHNQHKAPGNDAAPTMTIGMHRCINGRQIDSAEALYYCASALAAGTYHFTLLAGYDTTYGGGKTLQFTLAQSVPAGGVIMFPWAYQTQATTTKVSTYASRESTTPIETVNVGEGSGGTDLGTADGQTTNMNHTHRIRYGSNNWAESAARQWLNSAEAANAWWHPKTVFDRPPTYASSAGFLAGFGDDFLAAVGLVDVTTAYNAMYEVDGTTGGSYTTRDRFFLPSMTEVGLGNNDTVAEGSVMEYFNGATDTDRIKYDIAAPTTAHYWWLRSPVLWHGSHMRNGTPSGALGQNLASNGNAVAAACVIY